MARNRSWTWTVCISLLAGVAGASIFWLYSPYGHDRLAHRAAEDSQGPALPEAGPGGPVNLKKLPSQAMGARYQMVADGKQVFLVDLKNGRVWGYFHHTKEGGFSVEDEGFLPIGLYFAGKKHYTASEIEPPPGAPGASPQTLPPGRQPQ
jgi:hypothetical protein